MVEGTKERRKRRSNLEFGTEADPGVFLIGNRGRGPNFDSENTVDTANYFSTALRTEASRPGLTFSLVAKCNARFIKKNQTVE